MLRWISMLGGLLIMMGIAPAQNRFSVTSGWKIRLLNIICYGSSTSMSALSLYVSNSKTVTARPAGRRLIPRLLLPMLLIGYL
jgi:hypothetical protein